MRRAGWLAALGVRCPTCRQPSASLCVWNGRTRTREEVHGRRVAEAERVAREVAELRASLDRVASESQQLLASVGGAS